MALKCKGIATIELLAPGSATIGLPALGEATIGLNAAGSATIACDYTQYKVAPVLLIGDKQRLLIGDGQYLKI